MNLGGKAKTLVTTEFSAVACPRPGIELADAKERWLAAHPENRILDYGDHRQPALLVGHEKSRTVIYEFVPEASPPGFTIEQAMEHLRAAGFDVRGEGPVSNAGYRTIVVCEKVGN